MNLLTKITPRQTTSKRGKNSCGAGCATLCLILDPRAGAGRLFGFSLWRKHVVIHRDHHRNKHDRVVEEMKLNPRKHKLQHAARNRLAPEIMVKNERLREQQQMLDVVPELDDQCHSPPLPAQPRESF